MTRETMALGVAWAVMAVAPAASADTSAEREMFANGWPRAFFFRASEGLARSKRHPFDAWERAVLPLNGIMGKALNEEIPGTSDTNVGFFARFKTNHPEKLVLLHYNGNARDPRDGIQEFFAGHWIYYNGCGIIRDLPAEAGESTVHVEDPSLFKTNMGRYGDKNEDIGICALGPDGRPDWSVSEQVELVGVDAEAHTLRVRRGAFGTQPRGFAAGKAYIAAHVTEGPWGQRNNLMWFYNYSLACPGDAQGRTCADVLLDDLATHFLPGGDLASFDGLEFDVMTFTRAPASGRIGARGHDCDADGQADYGIFDGRNTYGIGVFEFCRRLRERLGDGKLILADGAGPRHQRGFGVLNGIESEGWPHLSDWEIVDWSGGLNRHNFWRENAYPPAFSYVNHKFIRAGKPFQVPLSISRLVLASCLFTDSAITYSLQPAREEGQLIGIYDELLMGAERRSNWLGMPVGAPRRLGFESPDLLRGEGTQWSVPGRDRLCVLGDRGDAAVHGLQPRAPHRTQRHGAGDERRGDLQGPAAGRRDRARGIQSAPHGAGLGGALRGPEPVAGQDRAAALRVRRWPQRQLGRRSELLGRRDCSASRQQETAAHGTVVHAREDHDVGEPAPLWCRLLLPRSRPRHRGPGVPGGERRAGGDRRHVAPHGGGRSLPRVRAWGGACQPVNAPVHVRHGEAVPGAALPPPDRLSETGPDDERRLRHRPEPDRWPAGCGVSRQGVA